MRVFIGLREIAGYYKNLKQGFEEIGVNSTYACLKYHQYAYGGYSTNYLINYLYYWDKQRTLNPKKNPLTKIFYAINLGLAKILLFLWAIATHDVFIFSYNSTFFYYLDLPILKLFNKKIIYMFHGSDSRPPYLDGSIMAKDKNRSIADCVKLTASRKKIVEKIEKYADLVINYPPQAHFFKKPFILGLAIGTPIANQSETEGSSIDPNSIKILHSPSHPEAKGSALIALSLKQLAEKGYDLEFLQLVNQPNSSILAEIAKCSFVVDQLYSDTPLASFATEAAYYGKPAVIGGYYADYVQRDVPAQYIPPSAYCHPAKIEESIEKLVRDEDYRKELGRQAKAYVRSNWSPRKVAERYLRLINGDIPGDWYYDPENIDYLFGVGLPENRAKELIRKMVEHSGSESLKLADKPNLLKKILQFAELEADLSDHV